MQTFLPHGADFERDAATLDYRRLGKQRVETMQIITAATNGGGWSNHPATVMWRDNIGSLIVYGLHICAEWRKRGYRDHMMVKFQTLLDEYDGTLALPWWLADNWTASKVAVSHRSNLYRKDPVFYEDFAWHTANLPYVWPQPDGTIRYGK